MTKFRAYIVALGLSYALCFPLLFWSLGAFGQVNPGITTQGTVVANDCAVFINKFRVKGSTGCNAIFPLLAPNGTGAAPSYSFAADNVSGIFSPATSQIGIALFGSERARFSAVATGTTLDLSSSGVNSFVGFGTVGSTDARLYRDVAATLAQRNGVNAQTFRVYNTFTDASNYERGVVGWSAGVLVIGSEVAGTGTAKNISIRSAGNATITFSTNGLNRWAVSGSTGGITAITDNATDIGAAGATRPRNIYVGTAFVMAGFTVATLPAAGTAGRIAYVTDQLTTCAVTGAVLTGGGAVVCPVFDNGVAWVGG